MRRSEAWRAIADNRHRATGVALASCCALGAAALLIAGFDLSLSMCGLGGCSEPDDEDAGGALLLGGVVVAVVGLLITPRIARSSRPLLRAAVAGPLALVVGLVLAGTGVASSARPAENVTLFLMVVVAIAILVPPRGTRWLVGVLIGGCIAAAFGDVPLPGLALALLAVVAWTAVEPARAPDATTE